jgi:MFS family permease
VLLLSGFFLVERRRSGGTLPLDLLRHPVIGPALGAAALAGTLLFGITAFLPLYVQRGLGDSAYAAGASVATMSIGWPVGSVVSGRLLLRTGYRPLVLSGALFMVLGTGILVAGPGAVGTVAVASAVSGLGMGLLSTPVLIVIQSSVEWGRRGAATALNQFARTIGGAVGVALMGILLNTGVDAGLTAAMRSIFWVLLGVAGATFVTGLSIMVMARR